MRGTRRGAPYHQFMKKKKKKYNHKKLIEIIKDSHEELPRRDWQDIADCIHSDQVDHASVMWYMKHKKFYKWYAKKYLTPSAHFRKPKHGVVRWR